MLDHLRTLSLGPVCIKGIEGLLRGLDCRLDILSLYSGFKLSC